MKRLLTALFLLVTSAVALAEGCFVSGVTDQYTYFVAVDATDFTTRETGLTGFTVYRSRNGAAAAAFTTPTINETSSANMPGVYELLLDEDMTLDAGDDMQHMALHITVAGMAPVSKEICIARPKITAGETVTAANGAADADVEFWNDSAVTEPLMTARDAGQPLKTTVSGAPPSQTEIVLAEGASNNDGYAIGSTVQIIGGSEECEQTVADYVVTAGPTYTLHLKNSCPFTVEAGDIVRIRNGGSGAIAETTRAFAAATDGKADTISGTADDIYADMATAAGLSTAQSGQDLIRDELLGTFLNCEVNTANFAGDADEFACILTDLNDSPVTQATGDLTGLEVVVTSGAQIREKRFINSTTWDGANSELQIQLSRALPGALADAVTVSIR